MTRLKTTRVTLALALAMAFFLAFSFALSISGGFAYAATPTNMASLKIGHLSDIHYFPLENCYVDTENANYKDSDFYKSMTGDTKLVLESGMILNATVKDIIADAVTGAAPDIFVVSGDLSKNGERVALIDVANTLRYLQNTVRAVHSPKNYSDFQIFVVPGNHDILNGEAALYNPENGEKYATDAVSPTEFALIFAGLGYPNANLEGGGGIKLTDYFAENYWSSDYTGGYVASANATNFDIEYMSPRFTEAATAAAMGLNAPLGVTSTVVSETVPKRATAATEAQDGICTLGAETFAPFYLDEELNVLSYAVSFKGALDKYTLFCIDSTDRLKTKEVLPVRIAKNVYEAMLNNDAFAFKGRTFYIDKNIDSPSDGFSAITTAKEVQDAYAEGKNVYIGSALDHITGGRITERCLNWVKHYAREQRNSGLEEETYFATFHHNVLPHFDQEDDILKDFTLYNWEYTAKQLLDTGIRYAFTGHMHSSDTANFTDAEGRTLFDSETGSLVSYDSPRRYVTISRGNLEGGLVEDYTTELFVQGKISGVADKNITAEAVWNEAAYQDALKAENSNFELLLAANPNYYLYTKFHDTLESATYNAYVHDNIYGQLVDRLLSNFLSDSLVDTVTAPINKLLVGDDSVLNGVLGGVLSPFGPTLSNMAEYIIKVIAGTDPNIGGLYGEDGYVYNDKKYDDLIDYLRAVIDSIVGRGDKQIVGLQFGQEELGKMDVGELLVGVFVSHIMGRELNNNSKTTRIDELNVQGTPDNPVYRKRLTAAYDDLLIQCENGSFLKTLLNMVLNPLLLDDNSLIKTILDYPFNFAESDMSDAEFDALNGLANVINSAVKNLLPGLSFHLDMRHFVLSDIFAQLMPLLGGVISDALGVDIVGTDIPTILQGFLDSYLVDSLYTGVGGIAKNIIMSLGTDPSPDMADISNPTLPFTVKPYGEYTYNQAARANVEFNKPTTQNGRVPSRVTANFDTLNAGTSFTIKFYTSEDIFGTFKFKTSAADEWTSVSTTAYTNQTRVFENKDLYYAASSSGDLGDAHITIKTEAIPQYVPLIDLGLLAISHTPVDYETTVKNKAVTKLYGGLDRDNAPSNSVIYWNCHTVTISGLSAGAEYLYDLEGNYTAADGSLIKFSLSDSLGEDSFSLKTAPSKDTDVFDFLAVADIQGMTQKMYDESANAMKSVDNSPVLGGYDFILNAGDMTDSGKNFTQWGYALDTYAKSFLNTSTFLAAGNHEKGSDAIKNFYNFNQHSNSVNHGADGYYYSFNYANAHFIVLDTNDADKNGLSPSQLVWLKNDLIYNKSIWTFVLMHKSLYSAGAHATDADIIKLRQSLNPLFYAYNVDIVLSGHDHTYTTTQLIGKDGKAVDAERNASGAVYKNYGVMYVSLGTMGTKFYEYCPTDTVSGVVDGDNSINATLDTQTLGYISVSGETLTYKGYKFDSESHTLVEVSNIRLSSSKDIALAAIKEDNAKIKTAYTVKFGAKNIDGITVDKSHMPNDFKIVYVAYGREYAKVSDIALSGKSTSIDVVAKHVPTGVMNVIQTVSVERENYTLIIAMSALGGVLALSLIIITPILVKVTKRKKAKRAA